MKPKGSKGSFDSKCAVSSVVEHFLDTEGVRGSNPLSRTILSFASSASIAYRCFLLLLDFRSPVGYFVVLMISTVDQPKTIERKASVPSVKRYTGEVVYIYA